jgi:mannosyltransferase OCH1-like enzyme
MKLNLKKSYYNLMNYKKYNKNNKNNLSLFILLLFIFLISILIILYLRNYSNSKIENYTGVFSKIQIPKIIIQTWKDNNIPEKYYKDIESLKTLNSEFKFIYFTDDDIENFLKKYYEKYYQTYLKLPVIIQKIDFFRYIAIYHFGGFYFDLDITGLYSLEEILDYECIFPVDNYLTKNLCKLNRYKIFCNKNMNFILGQYAFAAIPKYPFIKSLIDNIHNNIENINETYQILHNNNKEINNETIKKNIYNNYIYNTTGPDYVTNIYLDCIKNNEYYKENIKILHYEKKQYFGKYAKHNYYGTWKKKI